MGVSVSGLEALHEARAGCREHRANEVSDGQGHGHGCALCSSSCRRGTQECMAGGLPWCYCAIIYNFPAHG